MRGTCVLTVTGTRTLLSLMTIAELCVKAQPLHWLLRLLGVLPSVLNWVMLTYGRLASSTLRGYFSVPRVASGPSVFQGVGDFFSILYTGFTSHYSHRDSVNQWILIR